MDWAPAAAAVTIADVPSAKSKRKRASRAASERPERQQDPRLWAVPMPPDAWIYAISPARMPDGRLLRWIPPMPVTFNLIQAKRYRDRGVSERISIMSRLAKRRDDEAYGPANPRRTVDCIFDLQTAVLCAFLAIESFANHAVETLPDGKTITYKGNTSTSRG
jgi:hypothetical protein